MTKMDSTDVVAKQRGSTFCPKDFKKCISNDASLIKTLLLFLKKADDPDSEDVVLKFLKSENNSGESVLVNLMATKRCASEMSVIFNLFKTIFLRIAGDLVEHRLWALSVIKQMLYPLRIPRLTQGLFSTNNSIEIKTTLQLLTSMVTVSQETAKEIIRNFPITTKIFTPLYAIRNYKEEMDVCSTAIYFLVSFLMHKDNELVVELLTLKGVLNDVFRELPACRASVIQCFLRALISEVINNRPISKTLKCAIFHNMTLVSIMKLFHWTGPKATKKLHGRKSKKTDNEFENGQDEALTEERFMVQQLAREFALMLLTSRTFGIVFRDPFCGTSQVNYNHIITMMLPAVYPSNSSPIVEEVIVELLKVCPDQIGSFLKPMKANLQPRLSQKWVSNMAFIRKIIASQDLIKILSDIDGLVPPETRVRIILSVITAPLFNVSVLKEMLCNSNISMRHQGLLYVEAVLKQVASLTNNQEAVLKTIASCHLSFQDFTALLWNRLSAVVPRFDDLFQCWALAANKDQCDGNLIDCEDFNLFEHLQLLINVIATYQQTSPKSSLHSVSMVDMWASIENIHRLLDAQKSTEIQIDLSKLLLSSGLGKLLLTQKVNGRNAVFVILELISKGLDESVQRSSLALLEQLLLSTSKFDRDELKMLLRIFFVQSKKSDAVVTLLHDIIAHLDNFQAILDAVDEINFDDSESSSGRSHGVYETMFDDILNSDLKDVDPVISVAKIPNLEIVISYKQCLNPLVYLSMKCLDSLTSGDKAQCNEFVTLFLYDVIHCHVNPEDLCRVLKRCKHLLPKDLISYVNYFDPMLQVDAVLQGKKIKAKCIDPKDFLSMLRYMYETKLPILNGSIDNELEELIQSLSNDDKFIAFRQLLCYIELLMKTTIGHEELFDHFCKLIENLVSSCIRTASVKEINVHPPDSGTDDEEDALLRRMEDALINSPAISKAFLEWDLLADKNSKKARAVSDLIVSLANSKDRNNANLIKGFQLFHNKAIAFVRRKLLFGKQKLPKLVRIPLVRVIEPFLERLSMASLWVMMDDLSRVDLEAFSSAKSTEPSDCGILLLRLLDHFAQVLPKLKGPELLRCEDTICTYVSDSAIAVDGQSDNSVAICAARSLCNLLKGNLLYAPFISKDYFRHALDNLSCKVYGQLARLLLAGNSENFAVFESWLLSCGIPKEAKNFHPLSLIFFQNLKCCLKYCLPMQSKERVSKILAKYYWPRLMQTVFERGSEEPIDLNDDTQSSRLLAALFDLKLISTKKQVAFCIRCISSDLTMSPTMLRSTRKAFDEVSSCGISLEGDHPISRYVTLCLRSLVDLFVEELNGKHNGDTCNDLISEILVVMEGDRPPPELGKIVHREKLTQRLIKTTLKVALRNRDGANALQLLTVVLRRLYEDGQSTHLSAGFIFELLLGHSNFLPGLLSKVAEDFVWQERLVDLVVLLTKIDPSISRASLVPIYLSAYGASLKPFDQKLLYLLYSCEEQGINMQEFRPFLWGEPAVIHYAILKDIRHALLKQPTTREILALLNPQQLLNTAYNFPLELPLNFVEPSSQIQDGANGAEMYDPRFLMPLFSQLVAPESFLLCMKFINSNALAVVFASLGSHDDNMRAASYHVIEMFYLHLEGARFLQASPWLYFFDWVANGIEQKNCRLSNVITVSIIEITRQLLLPESPILRPLLKFLTLKPSLDIWKVPNFFQMFHTLDIKVHPDCRSWMLACLRNGLRVSNDFEVCQKLYIFKRIMAYYKSHLASATDKKEILNVICSAVKIDSVARKLFISEGLTPFLLSIIQNCNSSTLAAILQILSTTWDTYKRSLDHCVTLRKSNLGTNFRNPTRESIPGDVMFLLICSLKHMNPQFHYGVLDSYVQTMSSILEWSQTSSASQRALPVLTSSSIKKLINIYGNIFYSGEEKHGTHIDKDNDVSPQCCQKKLAKSLCTILRSWNCIVDTRLDQVDAVDKLEYQNTFLLAYQLLLKSSIQCDDATATLGSLYLWLERQLLEDRSGVLIDVFSQKHSGDICDGNVVEQLLATYGHHLTSVDVFEGHSTPAHVNRKLDNLCLLNNLLVSLGAVLQQGKTQGLRIQNTFLEALTSTEFNVEMTNTNRSDSEEKYIAASSTSKKFLELWLKKDVEVVLNAFEKLIPSASSEMQIEEACSEITIAFSKKSKSNSLTEHLKPKRRKHH